MNLKASTLGKSTKGTVVVFQETKLPIFSGIISDLGAEGVYQTLLEQTYGLMQSFGHYEQQTAALLVLK
ncbi:hypothetical protein SOMG_01409 [Schizosaccharomyces osmophilus]|uniref:Uncharacterized protein n=1 Tax=Schizosaccharomyces osmophilus TaxID=2545709 RepID=A0AAE9WCA7_9SCHI|nr:uncharacterized protein SOMG_01409 [Schizosaccharomyces osmophilus]WBW72969.1 hypothetical protein SOMG_01409 [Schizosaccharomyces osmophilus]